MNKTSGGDGIPAKLFKILENDAVKVLQSVCQEIWEIQQWPQDWKRWVSIPVPKKDNAKQRMFKLPYIVHISHISRVILKVLQAGLQWYMNWDLPDVQAGFWAGTRDQIANIRWIIEKARELQENVEFCFIDYTKTFDYVGHNKLESS